MTIQMWNSETSNQSQSEHQLPVAVSDTLIQYSPD